MRQRLGPNIENIAHDKKPYQGDDHKKLLDAPTDQGRRVSPRLRNIPDCKKPYYGSGKKKLLEAPEENTRKKNIKVDHSIQICLVNMAREFAEDESCSNDMDTDSVPTENSENSEDDDLKWTGCSNSLVDKFGKSTFLKMKETLRLFNLHCLRTAEDDYHGYTFPLTVTIVLSGQQRDDVDNSEVVYNCLGGNDLLGNKTEVDDQVMHLGNMALKNNVEYRVPVRVIHGQERAHAYAGKVCTYDGMYKVVNCSADNNNSGVFKYRLKRLKGQPKLASKNQDHFIREQISKDRYQSVGLVCIDISNGQEDICIPATNCIDNPPIAPSGFTYINFIQVTKNVIVPPDAPGCNCKETCISSRSCSCAQLNGFDFPYVRQNGGRLIEAKDVVFECGPRCACGPGCVNRATQLGLRYRLEVFRTEDKGWAVRSWDFIPSGAPVCEYAGVLRRSDELDNVSENDFIFEIDCWQTMNEIGGRERRLRNVSVPTSNLVEKKNDEVSENAPEFCIDAGLYGNVARFINHSCEPNLFVQCILSSHHDIRLARLVLFAADDIPPMQELTYDYGYKLNSVVGPDGKIKKMPCNCGTADCRRRLY